MRTRKLLGFKKFHRKKQKSSTEQSDILVFDPDEAILEENLQIITMVPHERRGEFIKPLKGKTIFRCISSINLRPVNINQSLFADYPGYFTEKYQTCENFEQQLANCLS